MRHDRKFWRRHVDAWRGSGLSQKAYCERHGLVYGTMNYWKRKLQSPELEGSDQGLVELKTVGEASGVGERPAIELVVTGRYLLRLWPGTRPEHLGEVLAVLESRP